MSIKKIITGLTLSLLLGTGVASANWGDVYYCQMTNLVEMTLDGKMTSYTSQKFQFKLDQTKNAMVFGSTSYFTDLVFELVKDASFPNLENWYAKDQFSSTYFNDGKLVYTHNSSATALLISADCDKF